MLYDIIACYIMLLYKLQGQPPEPRRLLDPLALRATCAFLSLSICYA